MNTSRLAWGFLFLVIASGCGVSAPSGESDSAGNRAKASGYTLTPREAAVVDGLVAEDLEVFIERGNSLMFGGDLMRVSARDAARDYDENQVAADQKYFEKKMVVDGVVSSINSGLGNVPYVTLSGTNEFMAPQIHFRRGVDVEPIAALKKGQAVSFHCEGGGAVVGTAMFRRCVFLQDYGQEKKAELEDDVASFLKGSKNASGIVKTIVLYGVALAGTLPEDSRCVAEGVACSAEFEAALESPGFEEQKAVAMERLRAAGLDFPESDESAT